MAHFNPDDLLITQNEPADTFLHYDSTGAIIDTHGPVTLTDPLWDHLQQVHHDGDYLYLLLDSNIRRWDMDGNDLGVWFTQPYPGPSSPFTYYSMTFDAVNGDALIFQRNQWTGDNSIARVSQAGVLLNTYTSYVNPGSPDNTHPAIYYNDPCILYNGQGDTSIRHYDVCTDTDLGAFYADFTTKVWYGLAVDQAANLLYAGYASNPFVERGVVSIDDTGALVASYPQTSIVPTADWLPREIALNNDATTLWAVSRNGPFVGGPWLGQLDIATSTWSFTDLASGVLRHISVVNVAVKYPGWGRVPKVGTTQDLFSRSTP